ncbi:hypothetical protein Tco_1540786 [Tanacetum coccineum]
MPNFDVRKKCGFETDWITVSGCMNITNRQEFESRIDNKALSNVVSACNQSLDGASCPSCTVALSNLQANYLNGKKVGNITDCSTFPFMYVAAFVNPSGPMDRDTAYCLFSLNIESKKQKNKKKSIVLLLEFTKLIPYDRDGRSTTTFEMDEHSDAKDDMDEEVEDEMARLSGSR